MPSSSFTVPDDFRAFMREVAAKLDWGDDSAHELQHDCGRGVRERGGYRFTYFAKDGHGRWEIVLHEQQIRDVAAGILTDVEANELDPSTRTMRGEPLLVWGEYDEDALRVRSLTDLGIALDGLHASANTVPCAVRLWSAADDQAVAVIHGDDCAIYIVACAEGYGTSVGDPTRQDSFELVDHDAGALVVPWSDCVPWRVARTALIRFAERGELGDGVILEGRIPSQLLMFGDFGREAELESRRPPTPELAKSSLPRKSPCWEWAERLLGSLVELHLIEIDMSIRDAITARSSLLLQQLGSDAQEDLAAAQQLAKELAKLRGVGALFATAGDLQIALRRTQDPPTMPVEMPLR